eukprot:12851549-Ditylum_brightwellii.AAC.1
MENCMMIKLVNCSNIQESWYSKVSPKRRHGNHDDGDGVAEENVMLVKNGLAWKEMKKLLYHTRSGVADIRNKDAALAKK